MKLSEAIKQLQEFQAECGDVELLDNWGSEVWLEVRNGVQRSGFNEQGEEWNTFEDRRHVAVY
jgi:hypothetical protein